VRPSQWLYTIPLRLRSLFRRHQVDQELEEELSYHIQEKTDEYVSKGLDPVEARRQAMLDMEGIDRRKEECREMRKVGWIHDLAQDLRYGARTLRKSPGFTVVALLTLALGIGGTTALFSVVDSVLLRPLPYPDPQHLVRVFDANRERGVVKSGVSLGNLMEWRRRTSAFSALAGWYKMGRTLRADQDAQVMRVAQVTEDFFPALRVYPAIGRVFTPEEVARSEFNRANAPLGTDLVALISDRLWRSRFGGDAAVLNRGISLDRRPVRIIGVMPQGFTFPSGDVDLWIPWGLGDDPPKDQRYVEGMARVADGYTIAQAETALAATAAHLAEEFPEQDKGWSARLVPLHEDVTGASRQALWLLLGAVLCLLLIGCANVAHLQLIRASRYTRETAVRLALGASPGRLLRQFATESLLLCACGGLGGVLLATGALEWIRWARPAQLPRSEEVSVHFPVLLFAAAVIVLASLATGIAPALGAIRNQLAPSLAEGGRSGVGGRATQRLRNALVIAETAAAVLLLVSAGLLGRSFARLWAVDPGFSYQNVLVLPVFLDSSEYTSGAKSRAYYAQLTAKLAALPGVVSVGGATTLPASPLGPDFERPVWAEGTAPAPAEALRADVRIVTPDYLRTLGTPVVRGRGFGFEDTPDSERVTLVNEKLAAQTWPGEDPVGKQLVVDYSTAGTYPYQVVGVVRNVRFYGLRSEPQPEIFFPHAQKPYLVMNIALRTHGDPRPLIPAVRRAVLEVDPAQPPQSVRPLEELVGDTVAQDQIATSLFASFSAVALFLAMLGIYGVMSCQVGQRTNEIGIRIALGAQSGRIFRLVVGQGMTLTLAGLAVGVLCAAAATRLLGKLLFGVTAHDPATFIATAALLSATGLVACWIPARRAVRIDPLAALRHE
jgi:predicted permease